ncbi:MAG: hypothetical protein QW286_02675 [Candidatus Aenigmatarchaeota archaeon]
MDKVKPTLILVAMLIAMVFAFFPVNFEPPEITKELCEDSDGVWKCESLCTGEQANTSCSNICVPRCECISNLQCPPGYYCNFSVNLSEEYGTCEKQI